MLPQPRQNRRKLAASDLRVAFRHVALEAVIKLQRQRVAKRVRREIAEQRGRPMHVLQHAESVIRRRQPQIFLHLLIPKLGQIVHFDVARNQGGFKLEAQENMQIVRYFVRLDANVIGAHDID